MIRFGDIRKIIDKWTTKCSGCEFRHVEFRDGDIGPTETCKEDCPIYYAKMIKDDVRLLLNELEIGTDTLQMLPIRLSFKGMTDKFPTDPLEGDLWYLQNTDETIKNGNYYWYECKWNYIPMGDLLR